MTKARSRALSASARGGAAKRKPATVTLAEWDTGATGEANRRNLVIEDAADIDPETGKIINPNNVKRARRVDMLEVWHKRGTITTAGYNAAECLRDAFEATERAPGWPDNDRVQSSPKPDHAVTIQIDRLSRYHGIAKLVRRDDWPIINACVLHHGAPSSIGYKGRRYQAGLDALRDALDRLAAAMGERPNTEQRT